MAHGTHGTSLTRATAGTTSPHGVCVRVTEAPPFLNSPPAFQMQDLLREGTDGHLRRMGFLLGFAAT